MGFRGPSLSAWHSPIRMTRTGSASDAEISKPRRSNPVYIIKPSTASYFPVGGEHHEQLIGMFMMGSDNSPLRFASLIIQYFPPAAVRGGRREMVGNSELIVLRNGIEYCEADVWLDLFFLRREGRLSCLEVVGLACERACSDPLHGSTDFQLKPLLGTSSPRFPLRICISESVSLSLLHLDGTLRVLGPGESDISFRTVLFLNFGLSSHVFTASIHAYDAHPTHNLPCTGDVDSWRGLSPLLPARISFPDGDSSQVVDLSSRRSALISILREDL